VAAVSVPSSPTDPRRKSASFLRVAHRGASAECPENTLVAFRRALELGAEMIECDLQLTSDGHVVIIHDWTVDRTTSGKGNVRDLPLEQIRQLDAGRWRDARFAGERVPTLEETLDLVLPRAQLNLELKSQADDSRLALAAVAAVSQHRALDRVIFSSFDMALLEEVREASPYAQIGVLWSRPPFDEAWSYARDLAAVALHPNAVFVTAELVGQAKDRGLLVNAWTVNDIAVVIELVRRGVDGVISDYPGRLLEARAQLLASS
jgi:glycerophosphoryl diester phosphodiesterase